MNIVDIYGLNPNCNCDVACAIGSLYNITASNSLATMLSREIVLQLLDTFYTDYVSLVPRHRNNSSHKHRDGADHINIPLNIKANTIKSIFGLCIYIMVRVETLFTI